jgi:diguanylate cyclase (GGDEF)-like protein
MKLKNKILLPIIVILSFSYIILEYYKIERYKNEQLEQLSKENEKSFEVILRFQENTLSTIATTLVNHSKTIEAYEKNDPQIIRNEFLELWKNFRHRNIVSELHFFKPPAISFVSFSGFSTKEIDVSNIRKDLVFVTSSCSQSNHIMSCRKYVGLRTVHPIINKSGETVGGLSVGQNMENIPEILKDIKQKESFIIYKKSALKTLKKEKYEEIFNRGFEIDGNIFLNDLQWLKKGDLTKIDLTKKSQFITINEKTYIVNILNITDFSEDEIGYIAVLNDFTAEYQLFVSEIFKKFIFIVFLWIVIYFFLNRNIKTMIKKITTLSQFIERLQKRDFEVLKSSELKYIKTSKNELDTLSINAYKMGISLKDLYENQQGVIEDSVAELKKMIYVDSLTDLPNRKALEKKIIEYKHPLAVVIVDVDNFSQVNNFFGTITGDVILKEVSKHLQKISINWQTSIYRIGSDEFAIIYYDEAQNLESFIANILSNASGVKIHHLPNDLELEVDLSAGISKGGSASVENSDMALHKAKDKKIPFYIYDKEILSLKDEQEKNLHLLSTIKNGILKDKFTVFFQPIFNAKREIVKYETLVRLFDGKVYLTPYHFLPYAKKTKFYFEITKIVITKSMESFKNSDSKFSINLSADDITNKDINQFIERSLSTFHKPENITFEILESEQIEDLEAIKDFIKRVRKYGVKIAIDDFGSGYSNFSYLLQIQPDILKLDGSLIKGIASDESSYLITKLIVEFAHKSGFTVIAEFVDSEIILQKGIELGIDSFQGFHLAKPSKDI